MNESLISIVRVIKPDDYALVGRVASVVNQFMTHICWNSISHSCEACNAYLSQGDQFPVHRTSQRNAFSKENASIIGSCGIGRL